MPVCEMFIEGFPVDLSEDMAADVTLTLGDIRNPDKRQTNYSKSTTLPVTRRNSQIFGFIDDLDVTNDQPATADFKNVGYNYTPKKFSKCQVFNDSILVFDGTIRLMSVVFANDIPVYDVVLFGKLFDIFSALGDAKLGDIDFTVFNHAYTWENIIATWQPAYTGPFIYPFVDYGVNTENADGQPQQIKFGSLIPALRYSVYIDKIMSYAKAKYILNFADRSIYDKLIVAYGQPIIGTPDTPKYLKTNCVGEQYFTNNQYIVLQDSVESNSQGFTFSPDKKSLIFSKDLSTSFRFSLTENSIPFPNTQQSNFATIVTYRIVRVRAGVETELTSLVQQYTKPFGGSYGDALNEKNLVFEVPKNDFLNGDSIRFNINSDGSTLHIKTGMTIEAVSPADTFNYGSIAGNTYDFTKSVPVDIKQVDFIKDFIKNFNLFVTQDPQDPTIFSFTPQVDFYKKDKSKAVDWTRKLNRSNATITPIAGITAKNYLFTYKQDKDFWNDEYFNKNQEVYGQVTYITDTDITKDSEKIESIFSTSVLQRYKNSWVICPGVFKVNVTETASTKAPDKFNARLLIWGGLKLAGHIIVLQKSDGTPDSSTVYYPYAGHLDDPYTPTFDLNFGNTNTDLPRAAVNQFSKYWGAFLRDNNSKDSRLYACEMLLNVLDIANLDFSQIYRVFNQNYHLNKVDGYNPFDYATSKVELIKIL